MPSAHRQKKSVRPSAKPAAARRRSTPKAAVRRPPTPAAQPSKSAKPAKAPAAKPSRAPAVPSPSLEIPLPGGRRHVLSLSFVRDGDEFLARLETDSGHIIELKNRSLDQLLTLVASELEDLLE